MLRGRSRVGGDQADHALGSGHGRVVAQPPNVALAVDGYGSHAMGARLVDGHSHRPFGDDEPEAPVAVDHCRAGRLPLHHEGRAGHDVPHVDALRIGRDLDYTVGVVTREVRLDQVCRHCIRFGLGSALGAIDVIGHLVKILGRKDGHERTSAGGGFLAVGILPE